MKELIFNFLLLQYFDLYKPRYKKFMSTIFKLLVAKDEEENQNLVDNGNINISREVERIVSLEREFLDVMNLSFLYLPCRYKISQLPASIKLSFCLQACKETKKHA